jgi:hypothetical protein
VTGLAPVMPPSHMYARRMSVLFTSEEYQNDDDDDDDDKIGNLDTHSDGVIHNF